MKVWGCEDISEIADNDVKESGWEFKMMWITWVKMLMREFSESELDFENVEDLDENTLTRIYR